MEQITDNEMDFDAINLQQAKIAVPASAKEPIKNGESLRDAVIRNLDEYFEMLNGAQPHHELYPMVIQAVEKPLLEIAMKRCGNNKCAAAHLLGINRNTLHRKLQFYKID